MYVSPSKRKKANDELKKLAVKARLELTNQSINYTPQLLQDYYPDYSGAEVFSLINRIKNVARGIVADKHITSQLCELAGIDYEVNQTA